MSIDGSTKVLGIIGDPVAHSLSPRMQNAAIAAAGINAVYLPFHVRPEALGPALAAVRSLGLLGLNVTVPYKEAVLPFLDAIDPAAVLIGAVNTIVNRDGRLTGYNTDGVGFLRSLQEKLGFSPSGKRIVLLGAGGAARAALVVLAQSGAREIVIANRTRPNGEKLAIEFSALSPVPLIRAVALDDAELMAALAQTDLLVNTTTVGLKGDAFSLPLVEHLGSQALLYDMVYATDLTPLQRAAEAAGVRFSDGRGMLVGQGEAAFQLWFDVAPPAGVMRSAVIK